MRPCPNYSILNRLLSLTSNNNIRINYHISTLFNKTSTLWSGHIVHYTILILGGLKTSNNLVSIFYPKTNLDNHVFKTLKPKEKHLLTLLGGININSSSLELSDISHHHLALNTLLLWTLSLYTGLYKKLGHTLRELSYISNTRLKANIKAAYSSLNIQLSLGLFTITILV